MFRSYKDKLILFPIGWAFEYTRRYQLRESLRFRPVPTGWRHTSYRVRTIENLVRLPRFKKRIFKFLKEKRR